jgi:translocation and assembly module TamB
MSDAIPVRSEKRSGWRRRLAWVTGSGLLFVALATTTIDFWGPALAARRAGATYARSEILLGRQIIWKALQWSDRKVTLEAREAVVSSPWRVLFRSQADLEMNGWILTIDTERRADGSSVGAWGDLIPALRSIGQNLERWVGEATFTGGYIQIAGQRILVSRLSVKGGTLSGIARTHGENIEFTVGLLSGLVQLGWQEGKVAISGQVNRTGLSGVLRWEKNLATLTGVFENGKWIPETLLAEGKDWLVPASRFGLESIYEDLRGDFIMRRKGEGVQLALTGTARPKISSYPSAKYQLGGEVSPTHIRLDSLMIDSPQLIAHLSAPLEWREGQGWHGEGKPVFDCQADLGTFTNGKVTGRAEGLARFEGGPGQPWNVHWTAKISDGSWCQATGASVEMRGLSDESATQIDLIKVTLADGSKAEAGGRLLYTNGWDIQAATITGETSEAALRAWLPGTFPHDLHLGRIGFAVKAGGHWPNLAYEGDVTAESGDLEGWATDQISFSGKGHSTIFEKLVVTAKRGKARLTASVAGDLRSGLGGEVAITASDGRELASEGLSDFTWSGDHVTARIHLAGAADTKLHLDWQDNGDVALHIRNIGSNWLADWRRAPDLPDLTLREFELNGRTLDSGLLDGVGSLNLSWRRPGLSEIWASSGFRASEAGFAFTETKAGMGADTMFSGEGEVPWRIRNGLKAHVEPVEGHEWLAHLDTLPGSTKWAELAQLAGLEVGEPTLAFRVSGPATAPLCEGALSLARLGMKGAGLPVGGIELKTLRFDLAAKQDELAVQNFSFEIDRQRVEAEGRLGLAPGDWAQLRNQPYIWMRDHAEARFIVRDASVAELVHYMPKILAPAGTIAADVRLTPGQNLDGTISLHGVSSRPLGGFGVMHDINMDLALAGHEVRIVAMHGMAGGEAVNISGGARRVDGALPALDLTVKANRFPLMRLPGLLLRGDLALHIKTKPDNHTRIGGEIRLRDSLFLADVRPLIAASRESAATIPARPPYFSVETQPLADWELGLRVVGDGFLRIRTPVFEGVGSALFELTGTLFEPRATGEFWVERGHILFPFASFAVQEGALRLRVNDPYTPVLSFRATARRLGYDLRLEIGGTAEAPQLQLSSSPPLSAENLMLMITTGKGPTEDRGSASSTQRLAAVGAYMGRDMLRSLGLGTASEDRFTINSGEKISRQGRETYGFEFKLDPKWSLTGEYDEFDAYNAGLKRRFGAADPSIRAQRPVDREENPDE